MKLSGRFEFHRWDPEEDLLNPLRILEGEHYENRFANSRIK